MRQVPNPLKGWCHRLGAEEYKYREDSVCVHKYRLWLCLSLRRLLLLPAIESKLVSRYTLLMSIPSPDDWTFGGSQETSSLFKSWVFVCVCVCVLARSLCWCIPFLVCPRDSPLLLSATWPSTRRARREKNDMHSTAQHSGRSMNAIKRKCFIWKKRASIKLPTMGPSSSSSDANIKDNSGNENDEIENSIRSRLSPRQQQQQLFSCSSSQSLFCRSYFSLVEQHNSSRIAGQPFPMKVVTGEGGGGRENWWLFSSTLHRLPTRLFIFGVHPPIGVKNSFKECEKENDFDFQDCRRPPGTASSYKI